MKGKSFIGVFFSFIFALVGFVAHSVAIFMEKDLLIVILAFMYVTPLLIDTIEDFSSLSACNLAQYYLDEASIIVGSIHLTIVLLVFALETVIDGLQIVGSWECFIKTVLMVLPAVFIIRMFYAVRIKWNQNRNVAEARYHQENVEFINERSE